MIVLDTNVVSAVMGAQDAAVIAWLATRPAATVWTTAVTVFEIQSGLQMMPEGKRRRGLQADFDAFLIEDIKERVLPFHKEAALEAGRLIAITRRLGRHPEFRDAQIAGIVAAHNATLATRNTRYFDDFSITLVNPWEAR